MNRYLVALGIVALFIAGCTQPHGETSPTSQPTVDDADDTSEVDTDVSDADIDDTDTRDTFDASEDVDDVEEPDPTYTEGDPPYGSDQVELLGADEEDEDLSLLFQADQLTWEQGFQGGFHLWGGFRASGEDFSQLEEGDYDDVVHEYELFDETGELIATTNRHGFVESTAEGIRSQSFQIIMRRSLDAEETVDGPYQFIVTVDVPDGSTHESRVWIYLDCCHWL